MRSLSGIRVQALLQATLENLVDGSTETASVSQGLNITPDTRLTNGTGAWQANRIWTDKDRTLSSGANESIDLFDLGSLDLDAGAGKDALGQAWQAAEIVALAIAVDADSVGTLLVGGLGTSATWNSLFNADDDAAMGPLPAGSFFVICVPADPALVVADTTNHLLKIAAAGGNVTYSIGVLARDA